MREVVIGLDKQRRLCVFTLLRWLLPLPAVAWLMKRESESLHQAWLMIFVDPASVDNSALFTILLVVTAVLATNALVILVEFIYTRKKGNGGIGPLVILIAAGFLSAFTAWSTRRWIAQTQPARNDPQFDDDGGWELWLEYMDEYWGANNYRVIVIALIVFTIGLWAALNWPELKHLGDYHHRRAAFAWIITGLVFIAALLILPTHAWTPDFNDHSRPWRQPQAWFPHRYLSSAW